MESLMPERTGDHRQIGEPNRLWPAVSVVVPTRDRPELLRRAAESILRQRYLGRIECIIVFDQTDIEMAPMELPEDRSVRLVANDRTPGLAGARNAGILASRGDLVAFCDDDDEWFPDKLRLQVQRMMAGPTAVACGVHIHHRGRTISRVPKSPNVGLAQLRRSRVMEINPSTILVRRADLLGAIGLVDESIPGSYAEDYEWLLRAARLGPIAVVQMPLARVQWHGASWFEGRWRTTVSALQYLLRKHPDLREDRRGLARILGQIAFAHAATGNPSAARRWAIRSLRSSWRERRAYLALAIAAGAVRAETVLRLARARGRGI
jgi:glycosyltransferase involved in cell wall biosynthesis